jgi:hypothetical protein
MEREICLDELDHLRFPCQKDDALAIAGVRELSPANVNALWRPLEEIVDIGPRGTLLKASKAMRRGRLP